MSNNPINVRVSMINGNFNLPDSTVQSMKDVRAAVAAVSYTHLCPTIVIL